MSSALLVAVLLILALGLVHSILGERYILVRLFRRADLPRLFGSDRFTRHTLRFAWHLTTVVWWGIAVVLIEAARPQRLTVPELGTILAGTALASAAVSLVGSRGRHPAWLVFIAIGLAIWTGTR